MKQKEQYKKVVEWEVGEYEFDNILINLIFTIMILYFAIFFNPFKETGFGERGRV